MKTLVFPTCVDFLLITSCIASVSSATNANDRFFSSAAANGSSSIIASCDVRSFFPPADTRGLGEFMGVEPPVEVDESVAQRARLIRHANL
jgi:hypothetical protein